MASVVMARQDQLAASCAACRLVPCPATLGSARELFSACCLGDTGPRSGAEPAAGEGIPLSATRGLCQRAVYLAASPWPSRRSLAGRVGHFGDLGWRLGRWSCEWLSLPISQAVTIRWHSRLDGLPAFPSSSASPLPCLAFALARETVPHSYHGRSAKGASCPAQNSTSTKLNGPTPSCTRPLSVD